MQKKSRTDSLKIVISAENIPGVGSGLGYYLLNAIKNLSYCNENWKLIVIVPSSFYEIKELNRSNISVMYWDKTCLLKLESRLFQKYVPQNYIFTANYLISKITFISGLKAQLGNLGAMVRSIRDVDAIWVPHYAIGAARQYSTLHNLGKIKPPILFTIHDIHPVFYPDDWSEECLKSFWNEFVPFALNNCSQIITHTQHQKELITKHLKLDPMKISVTPCPPLIDNQQLNNDQVLSNDDLELKKYGTKNEYALYPGSGGHTHKNHIRLILAWSKLKEKLGIRCPTLVCTSKGHLWPSLKALIDSLGLQKTVVFTGTIDTFTLAKFYQKCMFVIVPTLYEGGGSGPVAEGLIVGKPVVCSNIPQIQEQLRYYGIGLNNKGVQFFDPEAIDSIMNGVCSAIQNIHEMEIAASENKTQMQLITNDMWISWAEYHSKKLLEVMNMEYE